MGKGLPRWFACLTALALLAAAVVAGCDSGSVSAPYVVSSGRVQITGPEDGSFVNSQLIDVRGQAKIGTLVYVYVAEIEFSKFHINDPKVPQ